jgi:hypothetical protein
MCMYSYTLSSFNFLLEHVAQDVYTTYFMDIGFEKVEYYPADMRQV